MSLARDLTTSKPKNYFTADQRSLSQSDRWATILPSGSQPRRWIIGFSRKESLRDGIDKDTRDPFYPFGVRYHSQPPPLPPFSTILCGSQVRSPSVASSSPCVFLLPANSFHERRSFPYFRLKKLHHEDLMRRDRLCETKSAVLQHYYNSLRLGRSLGNCALRTFIRQWELPFFVSSRITFRVFRRKLLQSLRVFVLSVPAPIARITGFDSISLETWDFSSLEDT